MGPLAGIRSLALTVNPKPRDARRPGAQADTEPTPPLVTPPSSVDSSGSRPGGGRPLAAFLTHLLATAQDAPQTRQHRRAAVGEVLTAYAITAGRAESGKARRTASGVTRAA
jgi:hypothetical protein